MYERARVDIYVRIGGRVSPRLFRVRVRVCVCVCMCVRLWVCVLDLPGSGTRAGTCTCERVCEGAHI